MGVMKFNWRRDVEHSEINSTTALLFADLVSHHWASRLGGRNPLGGKSFHRLGIDGIRRFAAAAKIYVSNGIAIGRRDSAILRHCQLVESPERCREDERFDTGDGRATAGPLHASRLEAIFADRGIADPQSRTPAARFSRGQEK